MRLSIIAAIAENGVIGRDNDLPWHLSSDLQRFKKLTMGHHLLLGRKTFESIGRALPGRTMVVISTGRPSLPEGVLLVDSIESAIEAANENGDDEAFVAGGAEIYNLALPHSDRLYLTRIEAAFEGDVHFPPIAEKDWKLVSNEQIRASDSASWPHSFQIWDRT